MTICSSKQESYRTWKLHTNQGSIIQQIPIGVIFVRSVDGALLPTHSVYNVSYVKYRGGDSISLFQDLRPYSQDERVFADSQQATMKSLLALMLACACLQAQAANLQPCDKGVRFSAAWFADPEVDNTKPAAELSKLGAGAGHSGTQLGHVVVETRLAVVPQTLCQGVVVRLDYIKPVLRVASEIPPGSCAYARVMNHEQTHVRLHREIARQFRELDYPWISGGSSAAILTYAKQELDRLMQAQVLFDSPEEYARNLSVCGGEITRLVKPAASTPSGRAPG